MKRMKILFAALGAVMIAYVLGSAAVSTPQSPDQPSVSVMQEEEGYVVREENNRVVVYRGDTLWMSTDTRVSDLPKGDRVKLSRGIKVNSESELKRLIEDYCS